MILRDQDDDMCERLYWISLEEKENSIHSSIPYDDKCVELKSLPKLLFIIWGEIVPRNSYERI